MNTKTITAGLLTAVVASSVLFTSSANAFWPFDALFNKGEVKAAVTDKVAAGYFENSSSAKLSKSLSQMKTICTDLFSTDSANTGGTTSGQKEMPRQTFAVGEKTPGGDNRNKMPAPAPSEDKKVVAESSSILALMKNVCKQISGYNDRLIKVNKTTETTQTPPDKTGSQYGPNTGTRPVITPTARKGIFNFGTN